MTERLSAPSSRDTIKPKDHVLSAGLGKLVIQAAGEAVDAVPVNDSSRHEAINQHQGRPDETKTKSTKAKTGKRPSDETRVKMAAAQRARHAASLVEPVVKPSWHETMSPEEKLIALLPSLGSIERRIVVRSWGLDGRPAQSVDEITQQLFQGAPVWRAKVQGTRRAVQRLIPGLTHHRPLR